MTHTPGTEDTTHPNCTIKISPSILCSVCTRILHTRQGGFPVIPKIQGRTFLSYLRTQGGTPSCLPHRGAGSTKLLNTEGKLCGDTRSHSQIPICGLRKRIEIEILILPGITSTSLAKPFPTQTVLISFNNNFLAKMGPLSIQSSGAPGQ